LVSIDVKKRCEAHFTRLAFISKDARAFGLARVRRRTRILSAQALAILSWRKDVRALSPAAWGFIGGSLWLATDVGQLGGFAFPSLVLFVCLCVSALIDARYFVLPDGPLLIMAVTGVAMRLTSPVEEILSCVAAAAFGFLIFRAAAWIFEKARGFPGLGQGDARLFAIAGLWLGWGGLPSCLLIAALSAALAALLALRGGLVSNVREPLPFGPHLALGIWLVWAIGPMNSA
jgi:leader peptidase (prepilin peptidase)/N-methyltransferase